MTVFYAPVRSLYTTPDRVRGLIDPNTQLSSQQALLMYLCEQASQKIDEFCAPRVFYPYYKAAIYDWPGTSFELPFRDDLLSLTALLNGDGTTIPATSTVGGATVNTYFFYPPDILPKYKLQLNIATGRVFLFIGTPQQALQVQGLWGYPANEVLKLWYTASGATVLDASGQTDSATTLTVLSGLVQAGDTLYLETELELVTAVTTGTPNDTLTVVRGHNGTTAAAHARLTAIQRVLVHPVVARAAWRLVQFYFRQKDVADFGKLQLTSPMFGMIELPAEIPPDIAGDLLPLARAHG